MVFLKAGHPSEWTVLQGRGVWLRPPQSSDYGPWAELRTFSRAHLTPWEPAWPRDDLTKSAYRRRLKFYQREAREDLGYAFLLFQSESDRLIGGVTLSNVRRGVTQSAMLGYWMGLPFAGRGYMSAAVRTMLPYAFETLRLHRVEAAVQPGNDASVGVLRRVGFFEEGLARRYLKINGVWQDHLMFAMLAEDWMTREVRV